MQLKNLITNKYVLYIVVLVALANVVGYLTIGDYNSLIFFFVIAILSSYFSKNMTINLLVAILGTNVIYANNRLLEGLKTREGAETRGGKCVLMKTGKSDPKCNEYTEEDKCSGVCKWSTEGMTKGVPASTPALLKKKKSDDDETDDVERVDYAKTMEDAYSNLQSMLGEGGIKNLSKDTKNLVQQQKELMKSFEGLGPMIQQAGGMMRSLKSMPNIKNLQGMIKTLNATTK